MKTPTARRPKPSAPSAPIEGTNANDDTSTSGVADLEVPATDDIPADPTVANRHERKDTGGHESEDSGDNDARVDEEAPTATCSDDAEADEDLEGRERNQPISRWRRLVSTRVLAYGLLPGLALPLAVTGGFFKWQAVSIGDASIAKTQSVQAAKDATIALLSYRADDVEKDLGAARDRLTGSFRDAYTSLTTQVVIPGARQKQISTTASVPAAASVSATPTHAVVLVFVNQTVLVGADPPTDTTSSVKVTLDKIGGRWLVSGFDPV
jgi:Mce-associated membrane protein